MAGDVYKAVVGGQIDTSVSGPPYEQDFVKLGTTWAAKGAAVSVVGATALNSYQSNAVLCRGYTDGINQKVQAIWSRNGVGTSESTRWIQDGRAGLVLEYDGVNSSQAAFRLDISLLSNPAGIRVRYTNAGDVDVQPDLAFYVVAEIYGGDDCSCEVGEFNWTGALDTAQKVTLGIEPHILHLGYNGIDTTNNNFSHAIYSEGLAVDNDGVVEQIQSVWRHTNGQGSMFVNRRAASDRAPGNIGSTWWLNPPAIGPDMEIDAFLSDGFDYISRGAGPPGTFVDDVIYLAVNVDDRKRAIKTTTLPSSPTTAWTSTAFGFRPQAVTIPITTQTSLPANSTNVLADALGLYMCDEDGGYTVAILEDGANGDAQARSQASDRFRYGSYVGGVSITHDMANLVFTADGWNVPATHTAAGAAYVLGAMALEEPAGGGGVAGTLDEILDGVVSTAGGELRYTGALAQTLEGAGASGAAELRYAGTLAQTLEGVGASGAAELRYAGTLAQTLEGAGASGAAELRYAGTLAQTLVGVALSGSGVIGAAVVGALSVTLGGMIASGSGQVRFEGTLAQTLAGAVLNASGVLRFAGTLDETLAGVTLSASGGVGATVGSLNATLSGATLNAAGIITLQVIGTLAQTLAGVTQAAGAQVTHVGALDTELDGATLAASGVIAEVFGGLDQVLDDVTLSAAGELRFVGVAAQQLEGAVLAASGQVVLNVTGTLNVILGDVTLVSTGGVEVMSIDLHGRIVVVSSETRTTVVAGETRTARVTDSGDTTGSGS